MCVSPPEGRFDSSRGEVPKLFTDLLMACVAQGLILPAGEETLVPRCFSYENGLLGDYLSCRHVVCNLNIAIYIGNDYIVRHTNIPHYGRV